MTRSSSLRPMPGPALADASFDRIVYQFGIHVLSSTRRNRSVRPCGCCGRAGVTCSASGTLTSTIPSAASRTRRWRGSFPTIHRSFSGCRFSYTLEDGKNALVEAGFDDIVMSVWRLQKAVPDLSLLARGVVHGSPLIEQIKNARRRRSSGLATGTRSRIRLRLSHRNHAAASPDLLRPPPGFSDQHAPNKQKPRARRMAPGSQFGSSLGAAYIKQRLRCG